MPIIRIKMSPKPRAADSFMITDHHEKYGPIETTAQLNTQVERFKAHFFVPSPSGDGALQFIESGVHNSENENRATGRKQSRLSGAALRVLQGENGVNGWSSEAELQEPKPKKRRKQVRRGSVQYPVPDLPLAEAQAEVQRLHGNIRDLLQHRLNMESLEFSGKKIPGLCNQNAILLYIARQPNGASYNEVADAFFQYYPPWQGKSRADCYRSISTVCGRHIQFEYLTRGLEKNAPAMVTDAGIEFLRSIGVFGEDVVDEDKMDEDWIDADKMDEDKMDEAE